MNVTENHLQLLYMEQYQSELNFTNQVLYYQNRVLISNAISTGVSMLGFCVFVLNFPIVSIPLGLLSIGKFIEFIYAVQGCIILKRQCRELEICIQKEKVKKR